MNFCFFLQLGRIFKFYKLNLYKQVWMYQSIIYFPRFFILFLSQQHNRLFLNNKNHFCQKLKYHQTMLFNTLSNLFSKSGFRSKSIQKITQIQQVCIYRLQSINQNNKVNNFMKRVELSRLLEADEPSIQQSQQSHEVLVSKHLIPPPLSLLPKHEVRRPRSLTPMIPLPNFVGIIPNFQPLNSIFEHNELEKGLYYNWIGQAFDNIVYKKYQDSSYTKIDNAQQNWNIWACDVSKILNKKSAENVDDEEIKPYYHPKSKYDKTLIFQSRFECGNLSLVSKLSDSEYNLLLQNDINTNGYSQWFFFKVSNTFKNRKVKFNILNQYKQNLLYKMGMKIIIYSQKESQEKNLSWHRGGENIMYFENGYSRSTLEYKPYYTLSFQYTFLYDNDEVYFAYSYPYTYSNLQSYITKIEGDSYLKTICHRSTLCKTIAGNNVQLLTITEEHPFQKIRKGYIVITARIHPGESVSSYVSNGIIQFLLSTNQKAKKLRQYFIFKILPMLNPDGVIHGNYRSNVSGFDLNKRWQNPSRNAHPQIYYLKKMISNLLEQSDINLYCDLHGHSMKKNAFIYGSHDQVNPRKGKQFPFLISKLFKGFSFKDCSFINTHDDQISARTVLAKELKHCQIYALQSSFCGPEHENIHFTVRHFEQLGEKFCEAILIHFSKKIKQLQIQAAMRQQQYFPSGDDCSFETFSDKNFDFISNFSQIDETVFKERVNSENSQGSSPEKQEENVLEERTIKKYLVLKYSRPNTSTTKRNFLLRKAFSKDNIASLLSTEKKEFIPPKSTSPIKKKPLYETPVIEKPIKSLIKFDKKQVHKIQPKMFEPIDMIPLAFEKKRKNYRSHSRIGVASGQGLYSSERVVRMEKNDKVQKTQKNQKFDKIEKPEELSSRKSTVKVVINKNYEHNHEKMRQKEIKLKKAQSEETQPTTIFKNTWLKGFIKDQSGSPPIKLSQRKSVGAQFIIKKNKVPYSDDKNGANLFKNVLLSLRKDRK